VVVTSPTVSIWSPSLSSFVTFDVPTAEAGAGADEWSTFMPAD
jgi:hypothetical protein